jgi:hypothetical protein
MKTVFGFKQAAWRGFMVLFPVDISLSGLLLGQVKNTVGSPQAVWTNPFILVVFFPMAVNHKVVSLVFGR